MVNTFFLLSPKGYTKFDEYCIANMRALDNARVGKQRVEAMQILHNVIFWRRFVQDVEIVQFPTVEETLNALLQLFKAVDYTYMFEFDGSNPVQRPKGYQLSPEEKQRNCWVISPKVGFGTHSATRMWLNYVDALKVYTNAAIDAFVERGYVNNMLKYPVPEQYEIPNWITSTRFIATMQINLLKKDASHYIPLFAQYYGVNVTEISDFNAYTLAQQIAIYYQLDVKLPPAKMQKLFDWTSRTREGRPITDYFWPID